MGHWFFFQMRTKQRHQVYQWESLDSEYQRKSTTGNLLLEIYDKLIKFNCDVSKLARFGDSTIT